MPKNLGELQELETLNFEGCKSLTSLPQSLGELKNLRWLNLRSCTELVSLPESIGNLQTLKKLVLHNSHALATLPESIGNLQILETLDLSYCYSLTILPESIGNLLTLKKLDLKSCHALTSLPQSIGNLRSLEILDLGYCYTLEALPESIGGLLALETLNLEHCDLEEIPPALHSLKNLNSLNLEGNPLSKEEQGIAISPISIIREYLKEKAAIRVFLSHAEADYQNKIIKIKEIAEFLEAQKEVYKAYYSEEDLQGNFEVFMRTNVPKCQILLFFATPTSLKSEPCKLELQLAIDNDIQIIPILESKLQWPNLDKIELRDKSGEKFQLSEVKGLFYQDNTGFFQNLYEFICKLKRNIDLFDKEQIRINQFQLDFAEVISSYIKTQEFKSKLKTNFTEIIKIYERFKRNSIEHPEFIERVFQKLRQ
ncbi:MAG: TIR domain-containing protein [Candidatus Hodarchaeota archaeon]